MAIISPKPRSLKDLIHDKSYQVPLYQRSYNWGIDQISELWDDIEKNDPNYFLGTILLKVKNQDDPYSDKLEVVDGQQRLATLLLLLPYYISTFPSFTDS